MAQNSHKLVRLSQNHMATTFHLTVSTERENAAEQTLLECHRMISRCEAELSEFLPTSPIYKLNRERRLCEPVTLGPLGAELFETAEHLREVSFGGFHPGAKGKHLDQASFAWDADAQTLSKLHSDAWLGFGAIGKGYALDKVREILERDGFENFSLNAGGSSIILKGLAAPGQPWTWAWSWSKSKTGTPLGIEFRHESGHPIAIGVSGFQEQGRHIVNTVVSNEPLPQSALVATHSATHADALSTALFTSGWKKFASLPVVAAKELALAVIGEDGIAQWNGGFQNWFGQISLFLFTVCSMAWCEEAEESIDLGDLGIDQFNPYIYERDPIWILLPIAALLLVALHLRKPPRNKKTPETHS